ncbi:hypothetical protein M422DRAFT_52395 [Sphaerobolus stellatus SS14]|uniref:Uncharacterized protein n=1 Tax=Sphaerobolus stellatus (strain SS14) TaxID=990650 RepID=A0A0C9V801_SPHS4|nr:hypothetical protein M422DRAFT_52395 [Sphaerobolus stellatus SS14]
MLIYTKGRAWAQQHPFLADPSFWPESIRFNVQQRLVRDWDGLNIRDLLKLIDDRRQSSQMGQAVQGSMEGRNASAHTTTCGIWTDVELGAFANVAEEFVKFTSSLHDPDLHRLLEMRRVWLRSRMFTTDTPTEQKRKVLLALNRLNLLSLKVPELEWGVVMREIYQRRGPAVVEQSPTQDRADVDEKNNTKEGLKRKGRTSSIDDHTQKKHKRYASDPL